MREIAASGPWVSLLEGAARQPLRPPLDYYDALKPFAERVDIWHVIYNHRLNDAAAIVELVRSTGLKPFIDPLPPGQREQFLKRYLSKIASLYPATVDGGVLLRFPRLFIVAQR